MTIRFTGGIDFNRSICTSSKVPLGIMIASSSSSAVNSTAMFSNGRNTWRKLRTDASSHMPRSLHRGSSSGASGSATSGVTTRYSGVSSPAFPLRRGRGGGGVGAGTGVGGTTIGRLWHPRGNRALLGVTTAASRGTSPSAFCCSSSS
uniref:Uncharacterized protein n=1 Tax=Arundo donax TaxID=35708 RepID=A0A0A9DUK3_ARUDO